MVSYNFEPMSNGSETHCYVLKNKDGASVVLCDLGASILSIKVPDKSGVLRDVVLGYKHIKEYECEGTYFGATVGRCCGRIGYGKFKLDGKEFRLTVNNELNHLHGGVNSFSRKLWNTKADTDKVTFTLESPDGEEGYPGNMIVSVTYSFTDENELIIEYNAVSDKDTICNITNHSYFNLSGSDSGSLVSESHILKVIADRYIPINKELIPKGIIEPVENTPFDYRTAHLVKDGLDFSNEQIGFANGIDHMFVIDRNSDKPALVAEAESIETGIKLCCYTTQKGVHIYSANYVDVSPDLSKDDMEYKKYSGICFETQGLPDAVNHKAFPTTVLKAHQKYHHITKFCFES